MAVDCLDVEQTKDVFANMSRRVAGVFYIPVRLNDQLFINLTAAEDWKNGQMIPYCLIWLATCSLSTSLVHDVKVKGLKVLLKAVDPESLDFLVLTSSLATVTGSPGEYPILSYVCVFAFLSALFRSIKLCGMSDRDGGHWSISSKHRFCYSPAHCKH